MADFERSIEDDARRAVEVAKRINRKLKNFDLAIEAIDYDICDRRGLKWEWKATHPEIIKEIKATWKNILELSTNVSFIDFVGPALPYSIPPVDLKICTTESLKEMGKEISRELQRRGIDV